MSRAETKGGPFVGTAILLVLILVLSMGLQRCLTTVACGTACAGQGGFDVGFTGCECLPGQPVKGDNDA